MARTIKREIISDSSDGSDAKADDSNRQHVSDSRVLRSRYLAVKNLILEERDDISKVDSDKFNSIFNEVQSLHRHVNKPREQIVDAEALLEITSNLYTSVRATNSEGITIADFINCLLRDYKPSGGRRQGDRNLVDWKKIGVEVSDIFRRSTGCQTMIGPMDIEIKLRKARARRKRVRPAEDVPPSQIDDSVTEKNTDTDGNMSTMFDKLRKYRSVRLEHLVLNRYSFAKTVENLFALSFLVKDGRADIKVDEKGVHLVSPQNAPDARVVATKEVVYNHFVFRLDFKDWKLMTNYVEVGQELMPDREEVDVSNNFISDSDVVQSEATESATPIRKLTRNRGLVLNEQSFMADSPESYDKEQLHAAIRKGKRKVS